MSVRKRKLALVCLTTLASLAVLLALHGLLVLEPVAPSWIGSVRPVDRDLQDIAEDGVLRVAVCPDDVAFSLVDGEPSGLALDLARRLSIRLGIRLEPVLVTSPAAGLRQVLRGKADVLALIDSGPAAGLENVAWTMPLTSMPPVVLGRGAASIRSFNDLAGRTVVVVRNTALEQVAERWEKRLGSRIKVERVPTVITPRELAAGAARGTWPLVLMDQDRARLEASTHAGIGLSAPLDAPLPVRWAIRPNAAQLARTASKVFSDMRVLGLVAEVQRGYFENPARLEDVRHRIPDPVPEQRQLSPFDGMFRRAAVEHGLDWRLLAALSRAESGHDPSAIGIGGALGLMQLAPETAQAFGAQDPLDPAQNVAAAARHLRWIYDLLTDVRDGDRLSFAVAAYNMGLGHLDDARSLAAQRGLDPNAWEGNVESILPLLEDSTIGRSLDHGMFHGTLTRDYVHRVLKLYHSYTGNTEPARRAAATLTPGS